MKKFEKVKGQWCHALPWDSDDYLAIYEVSGNPSSPVVSGWDTSDGENFIVSNVIWDGSVLSFETLMPSTNRRGINKFRLVDDNTIESEFTFTVVETMKRKI